MKAALLRLVTNRKLIWGLLIVACLANGLIQTFATYNQALGMGDNSTFYAFTRNLVHGEAMYKDFIHFRTPGTVMLFSVIMRILGQQQSTIEICTRLETLVFYPLLFVVSAMILFRKKNLWYPVLAFAGLALVPGVAQLRAGFGLLTIAIYSIAFDARVRRRLWLLLSGFMAFVTFFFGQEVFLMVVLCMAAAEIIHFKRHERPWERVGLLAGGSLVGFVPLLLYMALFSSLSNFVYYTTYYSFIQQPKFMNLPFPSFGFTSLISYMPFILYWVAFLVVYTNRRFNFKDGLLLSFGILRLITAVGRSDFGHLLFSIPEIFIIVPYLLVRSRWSELTRPVLKAFAPYGVLLAVCMGLATKNGLALAPVPFIVLFALAQRREGRGVLPRPKLSVPSTNLFFVFGALLVLFVYMLSPTYLLVARGIKVGLVTRNPSAYRIGGVDTDQITYDEIMAVRASVQPLHLQTVFAFPIQPFYYSLAPHHASRFLTFEPEITVHEQDETISDLEHSKPQAVIFDALQAQGLSGSLWKISDYITGHYQLRKEVSMREILWVMVPKSQPARQQELVYQLYHDNTEATNKTDTSGIQDSMRGLNNAVLQNNTKIHFNVASPRGAQLTLSLLNTQATAISPVSCGSISVATGASKVQVTKVCSTDGTVSMPIARSQKLATITFTNLSGVPVIWNNPTVTDAARQP